MSDAVAHAEAHGQAVHHPKLQHHFETMEQQKEASTLGMWVFLLTEVLFFGGLFMAYLLYRVWYFDAFAEASRDLDIQLGTFNTVVLIGSSLTMALGVRAAQTDERKKTVFWLVATIILGLVFLVVKGFEYEHKFAVGHVPGPNFHSDSPYAAQEQILQPVLHDDRPARAAHGRRRRPHVRHHLDGGQGQVQRAVLHAGRDGGPLLALRRSRVDLPLPAAVPGGAPQLAMSAHVSPKSVYYSIFGALMALTALTVFAAYINLGNLNAPVALGIATFKATLVVLFFMHLRYSSRLTKLTLVTSLFFLLILLAETMMDYASRGMMPLLPPMG